MCRKQSGDCIYATLVNDAHIIVGILAIGGPWQPTKVAGVIHIFANKGKLLGSLRIAEKTKTGKTGQPPKRIFFISKFLLKCLGSDGDTRTWEKR